MKKKVFIVITADYDTTGSVDPKPRVRAIAKTYAEAEKFVHDSIIGYVNERCDDGLEYNLDKMAVWHRDCSDEYREWSIEEITV